MDSFNTQNIFSIKSKWYLHLAYWLFAAALMFFIFSNRNYDLQMRIVLVGILILASYFTTLLLNNYIIPTFLFKAKTFMFIYLILAIFIIFLWIITLLIYLVVTYSAFYLPNLIIPNKNDLIILIVGTYLIIILAVVIHFVKEAYRKLIERNDIARQKQATDLKLKEANLKLLQGQIHPHFLFNMLNNLYGLVKDDVNTSREVIVKLSDLLDYMLYECDKPFVKLDKELEFIKNYIELERVRHDENFNVVIKFSDIQNDIQIAPLVLFPFVENAFKHGFHNPVENYIFMSLELSENKLQFEIKNSVTNQKIDKYLKQEGKGIGLNNIKERLELIYKNKYQLDIVEKSHEYFVKLNIDLRDESEKQI